MTVSHNHRFEVLDGLRGVAAASVMLMHMGVSHIDNSFLAVDMFFLLSGFVIAYSYQNRLSSGMGSVDFMKRRFIRLYPMIFLGALMSFLVSFFRSGYDRVPTADSVSLVWFFVRSLFLLPVFEVSSIDNETFPLDTPMWSLFFEVAANFIYCLAVRYLSTRMLIGIVVAGAAAVLITGFPGGNKTFNILGGIPRVTVGFFGGVLLYKVWLAGRLPKWRAGLLPASVATVLLFLLPVPIGTLLYFPSMMWLTGVIILAINALPGRREISICVLLGEISYPLYLIHRPVFAAIWSVIAEHHATLFTYHSTLTAVLAAGPVALLSYVVLVTYDEPVRRLLSPSKT